MTAQVRAPSRLSEESSIYCCLPKKQCEDVMELRQSAFVLTSEIRRETDANETCRLTTLFDSEMPRHCSLGTSRASATGEEVRGRAWVIEIIADYI